MLYEKMRSGAENDVIVENQIRDAPDWTVADGDTIQVRTVIRNHLVHILMCVWLLYIKNRKLLNKSRENLSRIISLN